MKTPTVCRAAVVQNKGPSYKLECTDEYPVPKPKRGELLLRFNMTGLCLTDHHLMTEDWRIPMVADCAGHEGAGIVVDKGEEVGDEWKIGDRAGLKFIWDTCHGCNLCRGGHETYCDKALYSGCHVNGSFTQYAVSPARYTTRIPDGLEDKIAGPIMCSGGTAYAAIKEAKVQFGDYLVIVGAGGGVGSMAIEYGKALGFRVIAIDGGADKRQLCLDIGAQEYIDYTKTKDMVADVIKATGGGAHGVIVCGGSPAAYKGVCDFVRKFGTVVAVGLPERGAAVVGDDPVPIIFNKVTVTSSLVANMQDMDEALDIAARGLVKPQVTVYPFSELPRRLKELKESKIIGRAAIDFNA